MGIYKRIMGLVLSALLIAIMVVPVETQANTGIALNSTNFPDAVFLNYLQYTEVGGVKLDSNADGYFSASEISKITSIDLNGKKNIKSLKGVEYFTSLVALKCSGQYLTELNLSKNTNLTELNCSYNDLTTLDLSNNKKLRTIVCNNNKLTSLKVGNNSLLKNLSCNNNSLTALDVTKCTTLETLECKNNKLTSLNVTNNINLITLACENNRINLLDFTVNHINLMTVTCQNNAIGRLFFYRSPQGSTVNCSNQQISATMYKDGNKKFINMSAYGINDLKIKNVEGATYDDEAQCLVLPATASKGSVVTYQYNVAREGKQMAVTITVSGEASGKYPSSSQVQPTTPQVTEPPTTKPQPTTPQVTEPPTTKPQPTTPPTTEPPTTSGSSKPQPTTPGSSKPQPTTSGVGEQKTTSPKVTEPSVVEPTVINPPGETLTEPSGEITSGDLDNDETTSDVLVNPTIDSDDVGPKDIMAELKPILIAVIGVVVLIIVVIVVIIIVSGKKNGKDNKKKNDKDKYQYNNRIKY